MQNLTNHHFFKNYFNSVMPDTYDLKFLFLNV